MAHTPWDILNCIFLIIFQGIPPRGKDPNPLREKNSQINASLEELLPDIENTQYFSADLYVHSDGLFYISLLFSLFVLLILTYVSP